jgi:hypothetical protein
MDEHVSAAVLRQNESEHFAGLNHFTVPVAIMTPFALQSLIAAARSSRDRSSEVSAAPGKAHRKCATKQGQARILALYAVIASSQRREAIAIKLDLPWTIARLKRNVLPSSVTKPRIQAPVT